MRNLFLSILTYLGAQFFHVQTIFAAEKENVSTFRGLVMKINNEVINPLIGLLFGVALLIFLWGVMNYVVGSRGDEKKLDAGKKIMMWGIVGMFIMASAWGFVYIICDIFGTCGKILP